MALYVFLTQSGGKWKIKRAEEATLLGDVKKQGKEEGKWYRRMLIEKWTYVCMGEGGNLIKQAGRRRKEEW